MSTLRTLSDLTRRAYRRIGLGGLLVGVPVFSSARPLNAQQHQPQVVAKGWQAGGSTMPGEYSVALDLQRRPGGTGFVSATIKGTAEEPAASGLLLQSIRADDYRGRRVRLTAWLRTLGDTSAEARLWMRADGHSGPQVSDYMLDRPITGTQDWALYSVVLDIPSNAVGISFGVAFTGCGQVWVDDVALDAVGEDVPPTTGAPSHGPNGHDGNADGASGRRIELHALPSAQIQEYRFAPTRPVNLDFEEVLLTGRR